MVFIIVLILVVYLTWFCFYAGSPYGDWCVDDDIKNEDLLSYNIVVEHPVAMILLLPLILSCFLFPDDEEDEEDED